MDKKLLFTAAAVAAGMLVSTGAGAQALTDTEIAARFSAQRDAIRAVEANPALGPSRGLVLTNIEPEAEVAPGATIEAPALPEAAAGAELVLQPAIGGAVAAAAPGGLEAPGGGDAVPATPVAAHWTLPEDEQVNVQVTFAFDSAVLADSEKPLLRTVCSAIDKAGVGVLRIVGHTDSAGPAGYNQKLSVLRAEEVERFFVDDCGLAADRLQAVGVGEQFPFDDGDPLSGENRRVEFQAIS
ncbi:MAG TPA: OmpA family protein [Amaricoccus sp.]|nr:OmpA family protein [Amaricoccus sp.]